MKSNRFREVSRFSIRHKFIFLFFILIVFPFGFVGYFSYHKSIEAIRQANTDASLEILDKSGKNLDNYLNLASSFQNELMFSSELQELMSAEVPNELEELAFTERLLNYMGVLQNQTHGYSIRIFPLEPERFQRFKHSVYHSLDIEREEWFRQIRDGSPPFWALFLPQHNPAVYTEPILSKIKRLYHLTSRKETAVVLVDIKVSTLHHYLAPLQMQESQQLMLLDENQVILYHQDLSLLGFKLRDERLIDFIGGEGRGAGEFLIDGTEYAASFTTLDSGWKLLSMVPLAVLEQPVAWIETLSLSFLFFYLLLSIVIVAYITVRFTGPIQNLVKAMRKVGQNNLAGHRQQINRNDEIGWLYRGFDQMVHRIDHLVQSVEKAAQDKKELEFQVLTHQINPHFLYNTLESIRWKAESRNAADISEMVSELGRLLRLSLNDGKELTTVDRELEHVRAYVKIQNNRTDTPIRVVYLVEEELLQLSCLRLLLQPLVENSIKHAIGHVKEDGIKIVIKGRLDGQSIRFEVSDNGPGFGKRAETLLSDRAGELSGRQGVGLRNVHDRLLTYFGEPYKLRVRNGANGGAIVEFAHPVLKDR
ncbi:histidine kinase [Paenibacillus sp. GYB004]|uniref:cache domain-containing sensor histidine kinase n=1 Tax=Paenibacillus sp. GYB004 TaxID=2994393 RepID=UPI002F96777E